MITPPPPPGIENPNTLAVYQAAGGVNFRDLMKANQTEAARQKIGAALTVGYEAAGVRPVAYPSDISKKLIGDFVLKNYPFYTDNDILNAFLFAIEGKTHHPDGKTQLLDLYDKSVNLNWVNQILRAYQVYRANELQKAARLLAESESDPVKEHIQTRPKNNAAVKDILIKCFSDFKEEALNPAFIWPAFYGFLQDNGLIDLTEKEKAAIKARAAKELKEEAEAGNAGGFMAIIPTDPETIADRAQKNAVIYQFKKWIAAGLDEFTLIELFDRVCYISPKAHRELLHAQHNARKYGKQ